MKAKLNRYFIAFCVLFAVTGIYASTQTNAAGTYIIEDTVFLKFLKQQFPEVIDENNNDQLDILLAKEITGMMDCSDLGIQSLDGIQYFKNISYLNCAKNQLNYLNISTLAILEELDCSDNQLTSLNISNNTTLKKLNCSTNDLNKLVIENNTKLQFLYCSNNNIKNLDLTYNSQLISLSCINNELTSLDFSNNPFLVRLACSFNQLTQLKGLSEKSDLKYLYCHNNSLDSLNLYGTEKLIELFCSSNQLKHINLEGVADLKTFSCHRNQLTKLNLPELNELEVFDCSNNMLDSINLAPLSNLVTLDCSRNNIEKIIPANTSSLEHLYCADNLLDSLDISVYPFLSTLNCSGNALQLLDINNAPNLSYIDCSDNHFTFEALQPFKGIDFKTFIYAPQKPVGISDTANLVLGDEYIYDLDIDHNVTDNAFVWFKGQNVLDTLIGSNTYTIAINSLADAGIYTCEVTNADFPDLTLYSYPAVIYTTCGIINTDPATINAVFTLEEQHCGVSEITLSPSLESKKDFRFQWATTGQGVLTSPDSLQTGYLADSLDIGDTVTFTLTVTGECLEVVISSETRVLTETCEEEITAIEDEILLSEKLTTFPNPSRGVFYIQFPHKTEKSIHFSLFNLFGVLVLQKDYAPNTDRITIDTYGIPAGQYLYTLETAEGTIYYDKMLIMR